MVGGSVEASVGFGWPGGDFDPSYWRVVVLVGGGCGASCRAADAAIRPVSRTGEWLSAGRGAQPDGGVRTASRASCGRAA